MITNLLQPWLLARIVLGVAVSALLLVAVRHSVRVLRHWRVGVTSEGQLALERRAELVAAVVQVALVLVIAGLALTVLAADRLSGSIRGAMCAYGVFGSTPTGWLALATGALAAAACALWVVLHRFDLKLAQPTLTRPKFLFLLAIAPLVWIDLFANVRFALDLDLTMVASCCSAELDTAAGAAVDYGAPGASRSSLAWIALAAAGAAALAGIWARRRPGPAPAWTAVVVSLAAAAAAVPAILYYVAPHAYEVPHHHCPFCLLRGDVGGIGWPLFAAVFAGTILGAAFGVVELGRRASADPQAASALERSLGRWAAISWIAAAAIAAIPVVRFALASGGASLFGAGS